MPSQATLGQRARLQGDLPEGTPRVLNPGNCSLGEERRGRRPQRAGGSGRLEQAPEDAWWQSRHS